MHTEPLERSETFSVGDAARLTLSNVRGQVDLQPGEAGVITVTAVKRDPDLAAATTVELTQLPDGTVHIETRFPNRGRGWLALAGRQRPSRVDYTVRVPAACSVELSVVECDTLVRGLTGDFNLHTVSGNLRLADLSGSLRVSAVSGAVFGERLTVPDTAHLSTVSGTITLAASHLPAVTATTVSGDLNLQTPLGVGPYKFNSVSGDVHLAVPAHTPCNLSLSSLSGRIHSTAGFRGPTLRYAASAGRAAGEPAGPAIHLHSVSGDLWLLGPEAAPATTQPPAPPAPHRRDLLERLARGELTAEAAMQALKAP